VIGGPEPRCCREHRCRRSQPIRVFRSELTGTWYAVTEWADRGGGSIEAMQKHRVHPHDAEQLETLFDAWEARAEGRRQILDVPLPSLELEADPAGPAPVCRWCGELLHQRIGGVWRGPDDKVTCDSAQHVHEPREAGQ
jgi:hypothetical protein